MDAAASQVPDEVLLESQSTRNDPQTRRSRLTPCPRRRLSTGVSRRGVAAPGLHGRRLLRSPEEL